MTLLRDGGHVYNIRFINCVQKKNAAVYFSFLPGPVLIFPEGTRTQPRTRGKFNPGAAAIYSRCDVPVIPVALNTGSFWARRTLRKNPGKVIVEFLPPIAPGMDRKLFQKLLENTIEEATEKLELESPAPQAGGE